jgi:hypothetical protein
MTPLIRMVLIVLLTQALWFTVTSRAQAVEAELHVIPLKHRLAEEIVPALQPLLAPGESVSGMESQLIVRSGPQTFTQIKRLLAEIDTPRRNLRISVRQTAASGPVQGEGFTGNAPRGDIRIITTNGDRNTDGATLGSPAADANLQLHSERHVTTKRDSSTQTLTVLDGGRAFLRVGETIPQVQPFLALAGKRLGVAAAIQYIDVTTGFEVEPRIRGEQIQLVVTPRLAFRSNQGAQTVDFQELRTEVLVKPGEWLDLGGAVQSTSAVHRQILSTGSEGTRFLIRVDPQ